MPVSDERRPYRKRARAAEEERTRLRITEATVALHESVGPARTTIKAVAERAGVQRATVYRHFADEDALYAACQGHWIARHPHPDPEPWARIDDPDARLRAALGDLYAFYRGGAPILANLLRDEPYVAPLQKLLPALHGYIDSVAAVLLRGRPERGRRRGRVRAVLDHAVSFATWRSLAGGGLDDDEIVDLMAGLVAAASRGKLR